MHHLKMKHLRYSLASLIGNATRALLAPLELDWSTVSLRVAERSLQVDLGLDSDGVRDFRSTLLDKDLLELEFG